MNFSSHFNTFSFNGLGNRRAMTGTYKGRVDLFSRVFFLCVLEQTESSCTNAIFEKALEASIICNLLGICIVRMIPKPSKNGSAFRQINHPNPGLEAPKSRPEGLWGRFGSVLGYLRLSWMFLEASWTVLEASWRRLGSLLDRFEPKKVAKTIPN